MSRPFSRPFAKVISLLVIVSLGLTFVAADPENEEDSDSDEGGPGPNRTRISQHPVFLIVSYDGFRYDYFKKASTPHLDSVRAAGVHSAYMKNQFPTKTFPNHHSISTGLFPECHGVVENKFWDPVLNKSLGVRDEAFWNFRDDVIPLWVC
jgi:predicted AlkP superfamily pyrophosphatase or phosphodiesterase